MGGNCLIGASLRGTVYYDERARRFEEREPRILYACLRGYIVFARVCVCVFYVRIMYELLW